MIRSPLLLALAPMAVFLTIATTATAQSTEPLSGLWRASDGSNAVRIAPCSQASGLCATMTEQRSQPGDPSNIGQIVLRDLRPGRNGAWEGRYVIDGQNLGARVRILSPETVEFRVCMNSFLCETERYTRVAG